MKFVYLLCAASLLQAGAVTRHKLAPGKIYAGVPHDYAVYVPDKYDAAKPTPFMVFLDGSGALGNSQRVPTHFDELIAKSDLPPLIGIFVDPGVLPALSGDAQSRFHRILEYDSIDGRFARFLEEELIAEVAKKYTLSKDPNDHAISGVSTGAVGAFVAAWERPDLFRRVLSFIGTFVAMRGADSFPAMIRRTEPKPIRVFLEAGKNDHILPNHPFGTFYAGNWPINNQLMFEAMQFAGYDVKLEYGDNAHNMTHGSAILPDALRWLWRDYPQPIKARQPQAMGDKGWDPRAQVYSVILPDKPWEPVAGTVPGIGAGNYHIEKKSIVLKDGGRKRVVYDGHGMTSPSALALSPDHSLLIVADAQSRFNWSFQILADGSLANGEPFYRIDLAEADTRGSSGVTVDSIGQAYFVTALGIQLCEQNGRCGAIIAKPGRGTLSAIAFGGPDLGWLYAVEDNKLYRRQVKVRGLEASTRIKPPRPPL